MKVSDGDGQGWCCKQRHHNHINLKITDLQSVTLHAFESEKNVCCILTEALLSFN